MEYTLMLSHYGNLVKSCTIFTHRCQPFTQSVVFTVINIQILRFKTYFVIVLTFRVKGQYR